MVSGAEHMTNHESRGAREAVDRLLHQAARYASPGTVCVELTAEWYDTGGRTGPALRYLGVDDDKLPLPLGFDDYIALADGFSEALLERAPAPLRASLRTSSGEVPNLLQACIDLAAGGVMAVVWAHEPGVDLRFHTELRQSMGAAAYDRALAVERRRAEGPHDVCSQPAGDGSA